MEENKNTNMFPAALHAFLGTTFIWSLQLMTSTIINELSMHVKNKINKYQHARVFSDISCFKLHKLQEVQGGKHLLLQEGNLPII